MIEIKFPADRRDIAEAMGRALLALADCVPADVAEHQAPRSKRSDPSYVEPDPEAELADATAEAETADNDALLEETLDKAGSVDDHGVPFNPDYCGQAKDPFYGSGPRKGQWKKRKGVDESAYDEWYASQRAPQISEPAVVTAGMPSGTGAGVAASLFDSAQAFAKPESVQEFAPCTVGELMAWISEKQAAKIFDYQRVQDAYARTGVTVQKLFAGSPEEQARDCMAMYRELNQ